MMVHGWPLDRPEENGLMQLRIILTEGTTLKHAHECCRLAL